MTICNTTHRPSPNELIIPKLWPKIDLFPYIVSPMKAGKLNPTENISCACIVLLSEQVLRAMCRIEHLRGGFVAEPQISRLCVRKEICPPGPQFAAR